MDKKVFLSFLFVSLFASTSVFSETERRSVIRQRGGRSLGENRQVIKKLKRVMKEIRSCIKMLQRGGKGGFLRGRPEKLNREGRGEKKGYHKGKQKKGGVKKPEEMKVGAPEEVKTTEEIVTTPPAEEMGAMEAMTAEATAEEMEAEPEEKIEEATEAEEIEEEETESSEGEAEEEITEETTTEKAE